MALTIWKFPLKHVRRQYVLMPESASILSVGVQNGIITAWAYCDPVAPRKNKKVIVVGTGENVPVDAGGLIGRVVIEPSNEVYHVFNGLPLEGEEELMLEARELEPLKKKNPGQPA